MSSLTKVLLAVIGVAIVAVLVSQSARTSSVISATTSGFAKILGSALAPVSGATNGIGLSNSSGVLLT